LKYSIFLLFFFVYPYLLELFLYNWTISQNIRLVRVLRNFDNFCKINLVIFRQVHKLRFIIVIYYFKSVYIIISIIENDKNILVPYWVFILSLFKFWLVCWDLFQVLYKRLIYSYPIRNIFFITNGYYLFT